MKRFIVAMLVTAGCSEHSTKPATPVSRGSNEVMKADAIGLVAWDQPIHFKNGGVGKAGGVDFTLRMLPKLIVSGPPHEIEQVQIECVRGTEHGVVQVDTVHKRAEWGGVVFELGYADVYQDDIELTVRRPSAP